MAIDEVDFNFTRRSFLKAGVAGSVLLGTAGAGMALSGCGRSEHTPAHGYRFLCDTDLELLSVVMPVMLAGLPLDAQTGTAVLHLLDGLLVRAGAPAQRELRKLFDLLSFGPTRWLTTGVWRAPADSPGFKIEVAPIFPALFSAAVRLHGSVLAQDIAQLPNMQCMGVILRDGVHAEGQGGEGRVANDGAPLLDYTLTDSCGTACAKACCAPPRHSLPPVRPACCRHTWTANGTRPGNRQRPALKRCPCRNFALRCSRPI
ncbi:hypothetical protein CNE_BB1p05240 (plasmid) [Cupriavidus necator N-1]|uniref:Uncharacterized protein n=1 Tax=Cupriavidus necator (strain ATCC 43291 / DSM 13513 / CCUG 52238 / LMG 8453 / N-1) TaxID=1042878 RepID=F8GX74_CUPNN|nr:hypothetical protein CNE_BB1p05240 [Cupriavidus necator N-1]